MTNTTTRAIASLTLRQHFDPGDELPSVEVIKGLPEWDALRRAYDRGEFAIATPAPKAIAKGKGTSK